MDAIGIALAVGLFLIGVPIAYFVGRRNRQSPDLRSAVDFDELLSPGDWLTRGDLDITFDSKPLSRVSRTYLAIWNRRGDTVRREDILARDPIRIVVDEDDEILQTRVVSMSRAQIAPQVASASQDASVAFEFLDRGDGFILEVLHRGESGARVVGTVPGAAIRRPIRATLSNAARYQLRQPWPKRIASLVQRAPRRLILAVIALVLTSGYMIFLSIRVLIRGLAPAAVEATNFDLETFEGQREFAFAVQNSGLPGLGEIVIAVIAVLFALAPIAVLIIVSTARVPRAIARNDSDPFDT